MEIPTLSLTSISTIVLNPLILVAVLLSGCGNTDTEVKDWIPPIVQPVLPPVLIEGKAELPAELSEKELPEKALPTLIIGGVTAAAELNPDPSGRPSPLVLRLYELKTAAAFGKADFFALYESPEQTLGGDLLASQEFILKPGQNLSLNRILNPETRHIGLLAAYRDLDRAVWRTLIEVPPRKTTTVFVNLGQRAITAQALPAAGG